MTTLGELVADIDVTVTLPDGSMSTRVRGSHDVRVGFAPGAYERLRETDLEQRLHQLARLTFAARTREYERVRDEALGHPSRLVGPSAQATRDALQEQLDATTAEGRSADGAVTITATNMRNFAVEVADGTCAVLDEGACARAIDEAVADLVDRHRRTVRGARARFHRDREA